MTPNLRTPTPWYSRGTLLTALVLLLVLVASVLWTVRTMSERPDSPVPSPVPGPVSPRVDGRFV